MYLDKELAEHFDTLDKHLSNLGSSDSSVEYAPHIREEFNMVVGAVNNLKAATGTAKLIQSPSWYFGAEE